MEENPENPHMSEVLTVSVSKSAPLSLFQIFLHINQMWDNFS